MSKKGVLRTSGPRVPLIGRAWNQDAYQQIEHLSFSHHTESGYRSIIWSGEPSKTVETIGTACFACKAANQILM